jgi:hypothetical protein
MGYDRYALTYEDADLARLKAEIDVPTFCGEFSFPPTYGFERGYGLYPSSGVADDADAGQHYYDWVHAAAEDPSCVGVSWFQYRDQPLTGRGPGYGPDLVYGEHYAFGAVTVTDRPKWPLVQRMREANLLAAQWRLGASRGPFADIPLDYWAADQITACYTARIVKGYDDGTYRPGEVVLRDQMAVYLARALAGGDSLVPASPGKASFRDVPTDSWAFKYIEYASARGAVKGYGDETYRPELELDRAQMAAFLARALAGDDDMVPPGPATATFRDVATDFWAYRYVEYLADPSRAVSTGYDDGTYRANAACTRDQMAVFVARAFGLSSE